MWTAAARLILVLVGVTWSAAGADAAICVDIDLHTERALPLEVVATLEHEAMAIWAPYGVDLHWESPRCVIEDASFDVVIERRLSRTVADRLVLGSTGVKLGRIERVPIMIECDAVEETLSSLTTGAITEQLGRARLLASDLGRALGRIVAHELGHVLLGLPNHQRRGLMRASFRPIDLIGMLRQQYRLSPIEIARLRHRTDWIIANRDHAASLALARD